MPNTPLILITNDDGVTAQGIKMLSCYMQELGEVIVVAPDGPRSGAACCITCTEPVRVKSLGSGVFTCSGTPVDCVKVALEKVVPRKPDLIVSGINHGDNASINIHYSGTMGAVMEGCMKGIPSVGFSLCTRDKECDFAPYKAVIQDVARKVLEEGLPQDTCLNVNFPHVSELKGSRLCRMARGAWEQEWEQVDTPAQTEEKLFQLTGRFINLEPEAEDTDLWALEHGMASIVPIQMDMTHYPTPGTPTRHQKE